MNDMHYDKGMVPSKPGFKTNAKGGDSKQSTRGVGVKSGLSMQQGFYNESNDSLGLCTKGKNQCPVHPKNQLSTDHGEFTCY